MGKESAPPAPNYADAAKETAAGNLENARSTTQANRVNTFTPYGNLTYKNSQTFDQTGYDKALADYQAKVASGTQTQAAPTAPTGGSGATDSGDGSGGAVTTPGAQQTQTYTAPKREDFMSGNPDQWESTITLSPDQQKLLEQQTKTSLGLAGLQDKGVAGVAGMMGQPFDMSKVPGGGTPGSTYTADGGAGLGARYDPSQAPSKGSVYNPGSSPSLSGYYDPNSATNTATEAILSRVNPQLDRQENAMRTRLANQGITQGSEAFRNDIEDFGQTRNDAQIQAALQGINLGMAQQGQTFNQSVTGQNQSMAQQAQNFGQSNANVALDAQQQAQMFGQGLSAEQLAQSQQAQQFAQQNTNYQNAEQARQRAIEEQAYLRSLPLNELNALRTGAQVTNPTFTNAPGQTYTPGPDMLGAANQQYGAAQGAVNASNAGSSQTTQGLMSAASIAAMAF